MEYSTYVHGNRSDSRAWEGAPGNRSGSGLDT